jgi:hypothetical protein
MKKVVSCKSKVAVRNKILLSAKGMFDGVGRRAVLVECRKADMWSFEARPHFVSEPTLISIPVIPATLIPHRTVSNLDYLCINNEICIFA